MTTTAGSIETPTPAPTSPSPPPRRGRWRARLLAGLLALATAGYGGTQLGYEFPSRRRPAADEQMIEAAKAIGGYARSEGIPAGVVGWWTAEEIAIDLNGPGVDDRGLAEFARVSGRGPRHLGLRNSAATGAGLRELGRLTNLRSLRIDGVQLPGARDAEGLPVPRYRVTIGPAEVAAIGRLTSLISLSLGTVEVAPDAFGAVGTLPSMKVVSIHRSALPTAAMADLAAAVPGVENLVLDVDGATDADLAAVGRMPSLHFLYVGSTTKITPAGLRSLAGLDRLVHLRVDAPTLRIHDFSALRAARPSLTVVLNGATHGPAAVAGP